MHNLICIKVWSSVQVGEFKSMLLKKNILINSFKVKQIITYTFINLFINIVKCLKNLLYVCFFYCNNVYNLFNNNILKKQIQIYYSCS